jgi:hypothetical protein
LRILRLRKRSEWSHNFTTARLKGKYWNRPGKRSSSSSQSAALDDIDESMQIPSLAPATSVSPRLLQLEMTLKSSAPVAMTTCLLLQASLAGRRQDHKRRMREAKRRRHLQQEPTGVKKRPAAHAQLPSQQLPKCVRSR